MSRAILVLLTWILAGCVAEPSGMEDPVPSFAFGPPAVAVAECKNIVFSQDECYEPTIAADPLGRLFAIGGPSDIYVSVDGGDTWTPSSGPPKPTAGPESRADVTLQVSPTGRLFYTSHLRPDPKLDTVFFGSASPSGSIQVAWSDDGAATWTASVVLGLPQGTGPVLAPDRQWLGFGPGGTVYLTYNQPMTGIWLARSDDAGQSWTGWKRVVPAESRSLAAGQSGPPVVDRNGRVLVAACDGEGPTSPDFPRTLIFRSDDMGGTFQMSAVPGPCDWFPMLAVAENSAVALAVTGADGVLRLAWSNDGAERFTTLSTLSESVEASPWIVAAGINRVAIASLRANAGTVGAFVMFVDLPSLAVKDHLAGHVKAVEGRSGGMTDFASMATLPDERVTTIWVEGDQAWSATGQ